MLVREHMPTALRLVATLTQKRCVVKVITEEPDDRQLSLDVKFDQLIIGEDLPEAGSEVFPPLGPISTLSEGPA